MRILNELAGFFRARRWMRTWNEPGICINAAHERIMRGRPVSILVSEVCRSAALRCGTCPCGKLQRRDVAVPKGVPRVAAGEPSCG